MRMRMLLCISILTVLAVLTPAMLFARADAQGNESSSSDLIVGGLSGVSTYGTVDGISAYAIGTTACNVGSTILSWMDTGNQPWRHPVIAQNMYRLHDGRFEQIGMSWLKHGFCASDSTLCGTCTPFANCDWLATGCSDTYASTLNGFQFYLGPRSEVNPVFGTFAWPHSLPFNHPDLSGRLLVQKDDLDPTLFPGARYFAEGHYIHPDDAFFTNDNNASYDELLVGDVVDDQFQLSFAGNLQVELPAIYAWQNLGASVELEHVLVQQDGLFIIGHHCTDNGDGTWHYEYALYNMYSDRAAQGFTVPIPAGVAVSNIGFHDIDYHSNEPYDPTDWAATIGPDGITWSGVAFDVNENANALRWGSLYNVRFDATAAPAPTDATLHLFKPGNTPNISVAVCAPSPIQMPGDLDADNDIDVNDLLILLGVWGPCTDCPADLNTDGVVDMLDLKMMLSNWS